MTIYFTHHATSVTASAENDVPLHKMRQTSSTAQYLNQRLRQVGLATHTFSDPTHSGGHGGRKLSQEVGMGGASRHMMWWCAVACPRQIIMISIFYYQPGNGTIKSVSSIYTKATSVHSSSSGSC